MGAGTGAGLVLMMGMGEVEDGDEGCTREEEEVCWRGLRASEEAGEVGEARTHVEEEVAAWQTACAEVVASSVGMLEGLGAVAVEVVKINVPVDDEGSDDAPESWEHIVFVVIERERFDNKEIKCERGRNKVPT